MHIAQLRHSRASGSLGVCAAEICARSRPFLIKLSLKQGFSVRWCQSSSSASRATAKMGICSRKRLKGIYLLCLKCPHTTHVERKTHKAPFTHHFSQAT